MKNITLSADEKLIEAMRQRALAEQTTLNAKFREWLEDYVNRQQDAQDSAALISELRAKYSTGGRKFTREVMNER
ncbi:MAG: hypothetical protein K0U68_02255 [Gammaproteobacteria bacterium]|nr:hypothetical protein [Gammaproteobacteria bacterium]